MFNSELLLVSASGFNAGIDNAAQFITFGGYFAQPGCRQYLALPGNLEPNP
jgi:hypothetical protein